ncbi:MAG: hypothetical protein ACJ735_10115 [Actinomycetes bacterium]
MSGPDSTGDAASRAVASGLAAARIRLSLTPGQCWTAGISIGLATLLVLFGAPTRHLVKLAAPSNGTTPPAAVGTGPTPPAAGLAQGQVPPSAPAQSATLAADARATPPVQPATAGPPRPPSVVLAVRSGDDQLADRDDQAVARAMLAGSGVPAKVVVLSNTPSDCAALAQAGGLVVASAGLSPPLQSCLNAQGRTVVSFDELGAVPPSVSTRRDVVDAMLDSRPDLSGTVGVVSDVALSHPVSLAVSALRARGVRVAAVSYVHTGMDGASDVSDGVREFAQRGVTRVLFAADVATQNLWSAQEQILLPNVAHVVADVGDSIVNEDYGPDFDSAVAVTSQRGSWYARAHGMTKLQSACAAQFAKHQQYPVPLDAIERARVFTWCEHIDVVRRALAAIRTGTPLATALRASSDSPLTSPLGVDAAGHYGPRGLAAIRWQLSCRCWQEVSRFSVNPA